MNNELTEKIKECIETAMEQEVPTLFPEMLLSRDLGMESIHIVTLQVELEETFGIQFDPLEDDFYAIFHSVDSVYKTIERKLKNYE